MRALLAVLCLLSLTTAAHAVPTCVPGTMADYLALPDGCRLGAITVSDFSYSGFSEFFGLGPPFDIPPSLALVTPSLPFGASSLRLAFDGGWTGVDISYRAEADAPWIRQFNLLFLNPENGSSVGASGNPGGSLSVTFDTFPIIDIRLFDTRSFDPISLTTIHISGSGPSHPFGGVNSFAFDVVTPEPATLLLWGAGAAGLGLARWRRRLAR